MHQRSSRTVSNLARLLIAALLAVAIVPTIAQAAPEDEKTTETTEDVIHMLDGRDLHGKILEEKGDAIIFEFHDRKIGIKTKLTLLREEIAKIRRDVPLADAPEGKTDKEPRRRAATSQPEEPERSYGARRHTSADADVPSFYVVPMSGQMGTDVSFDVYEEMLDDIREHDPDFLVIEMDCKDSEDRLTSRVEQGDRGRDDSNFLDMYRDVVKLFRTELSDIPQILWIEDSVGISSVVAMSWKDLYMKPNARLGGIAGAARNFGVQDEEVRAKYREAYMGWLKGFAEYGGYDFALIDAMVIPDMTLSATWRGRDVTWSLDTSGEYVVDSSDKRTANFSAKHAENFCISQGTAESLDDLALLKGIREYRVCEGDSEAIFEDYKEDWRRRFENCREWYLEYEKFRGWASGEDTVKYLGRAKQMLEKILSAARANKAVEFRIMTDYGLRTIQLETQIEQINEQLRAMRGQQRGGRGGRGGGTGGGRPGR